MLKINIQWESEKTKHLIFFIITSENVDPFSKSFLEKVSDLVPKTNVLYKNHSGKKLPKTSEIITLISIKLRLSEIKDAHIQTMR